MNLAFLKGKKTYTWAIAVIIYCIIAVLLGQMELNDALVYGNAAFGFILMRLGVTKSGGDQTQEGG